MTCIIPSEILLPIYSAILCVLKFRSSENICKLQGFRNLLNFRSSRSKYAPLPNLTKDLYRVFVFQFTKECPESYSPTLVANYVTSVFELKILEDVSLGVILVADFSNITLRHIIKVPPTLLKKMSALFEVQAGSLRRLDSFFSCRMLTTTGRKHATLFIQELGRTLSSGS